MMNHHISSQRCWLPLARLAVWLLLPTVILSQPASTREQLQTVPAQTGQEQIVLRGTVHDPTGALIVRAHVRLVHEETSQTFMAETGKDGSFSFSDKVPPGTYRLFIVHLGFKEFEHSSLQLSADQPTRVDAVLDIAPIRSRVEITGPREGQPALKEAPVRVSTGVTPGSPLRMVSAEYPAEVQASGIQGQVVIEAIVNASGEVISARAIEGHPILIESFADSAMGSTKKLSRPPRGSSSSQPQTQRETWRRCVRRSGLSSISNELKADGMADRVSRWIGKPGAVSKSWFDWRETTGLKPVEAQFQPPYSRPTPATPPLPAPVS